MLSSKLASVTCRVGGSELGGQMAGQRDDRMGREEGGNASFKSGIPRDRVCLTGRDKRHIRGYGERLAPPGERRLEPAGNVEPGGTLAGSPPISSDREGRAENWREATLLCHR